MSWPGVLIVHPDEMTRHRLGCTFRGRKYPTWMTDEAEEAFDLVAGHPSVGVIVVDAEACDGDGMDLLERLRQQRPDAGCVLLTQGRRDLSELADAVSSGRVCRLVVGPCSDDELVQIIEQERARRLAEVGAKAGDLVGSRE